MSSAAHRDYRHVNQVDPGNRPEANAALSVAADRVIATIAHQAAIDLHQARVRLEGHIARLDGFRRQLGCLDPAGKCAAAVQLLSDLERDLNQQAAAPIPFDIRTSGEAQQAASDLRAVAAAESGADMQALPLVSLGQGTYRREVTGDPATGRLDVRA